MDILEARNTPRTLGLTWHNQFISRHPDIKSAFSRKVKANRIKACNKSAISGFFDRLRSIQKEYKIPLSKTYNMNESGIQMGDTGNEKVLAEAAVPEAPVVEESKRTKWTTSVECVSADGNQINPLLIFSGQHIQSNWFPKHLNRLGCKD